MSEDRVRSAIFEATAFFWSRRYLLESSSAPGFYRSTGLVASLMEAGKIMATVDRQRPVVRSWLLFAYGVEFRREDYDLASTALFEAVFTLTERRRRGRRDSWRCITAQDRERHETLARMALNNMAFRQRGAAPFPERQLEIVLNVARGSFAEHWRRKLDGLEYEIGRWDVEGVAAVEQQLDDMKYGAQQPRRRRGLA